MTYHERYCARTNPRASLVLVACLGVIVFTSWNALRKPLQQDSLVELPFYVFVAAILFKSLVDFKCFRERLVAWLALVSLALGVTCGYFPITMAPFVHAIRQLKVALWGVALIVGSSMLFASIQNSKVDSKNSNTMTAGRTLLILAAVIATSLLVGTLLYFIPMR
jgi:hypothetical protein